MANEAEDTILLKIKVDDADVAKELEAARVHYARLKSEQKDLDKERKAGIITAKEYAQSTKAISDHLAVQTRIINEGEATLKSYAKTEQQATQAVTNMRAALVLLSPAQKAHAQSTKDVQQRIAELSAELHVEEAAIKATASSMDKLDDAISSLDDAYRGLSQAQREDKEVGGQVLSMLNNLERQQEKNRRVIDGSRKGIKDYIRDIDVLGINVGATIDSFKSGAQGAITFGKAIFTSRGALIALAAVPIIAVLSGLYILLTKSQKGMDFLAQATSGVSSVFSSLSGSIINAFNAFADSKNKIADLGNFLEQNLINRFKALGVILQGIYTLNPEKVSNGILQLATGAKNAATNLKSAYNQGVAVAKMNQQIEASEISLNTQRAKSERIIERQKQIAEDTTKSTKVRAAAAKAAFAESEKIQNAEQSLQQKRVQAAEAELTADKNNRAYKKKVSDEAAKLDEIAKNRIGERTELQNQLNSIEADGKAKNLENAKKIAAEEVAIAEEALIQAQKKGEDTVEIEAEILKRTLVLIQARADAEKVAVEKGRGANAQRKLIQAKADVEAIEAARATAQKIAEIVYTAKVADIETSLALAVQGSKAELKLRIEAIEAARNKQQELAKATIADSLTLAKENARLVTTADRQINDARLEFDKQQVAKESDFANQRLQIQLDLGDQSFENQQHIATERIKLEEQTQIKLLDLDLEYGQLTLDEYDNKLKAIKAKTVASQREIDAQTAAASARAAQDVAAANLANAKAGSKAEHEAIVEGIEADRKAALTAAGENAAAKERANAEANRKIRDENERFGKEQIQQVLNIATQTVAVIGSIGDAQARRAYEELDKQQQAAVRSAGTNIELREKIEDQYAKKKEKLDKEEGERKKKFARVQAVLNTAVAITSAAPNVILMALAALTGIAQLAVINSQKFAQGGVYQSDGRGNYVRGPGTGKSDSINARISNGEAIINAQSTAEHYPLLSAINSYKGYGRPFPKLGPNVKPSYDLQYVIPRFQMHTPFAMGGVARTSGGIGIDPKQFAGMIETGVANALANQKPPVLMVSDLHTVEADITRLNRRTSVRVKG